MIYAVLLCNKEWNIVKIKQNVSGLSLKPGDCLADVVQDADELTENDEKQYSLFLTFRERDDIINSCTELSGGESGHPFSCPE